MATFAPDTDFNERIIASIEKIAAKHAANQRLLAQVRYDLDMLLQLNPEEEPLPCRETTEETAAVSAHFSAQVHALYENLAAYNARPAASLTESKLAPIDQENGIALIVNIGGQSFDRYPFCQHRLYHSRRLTLQNPDTLPALPFVRKLRILSANNPDSEFHFGRVRPISLRVPLECLVRLPSAVEIDCPWLWERLPVAVPGRPMRHFTRPWEGPWRDARHDFGAAMEEQDLGRRIPTTLTKAKLWFWRPSRTFVSDQTLEMPNLVHPAQKDPLCLGLRTLTTQLEELDLRAFITEDLFPPQASSAQWSRMRRLSVEFHPLRPDGSWYFVGPRGEDPNPRGFIISDDDHYPPTEDTPEDEEIDEEWDFDPGGEVGDRSPDLFRTQPLAERIEPLLSAFASAVKNMGALEEAELFAYLLWYPSESRADEYGDEAPYDIENGVHRWGVRYVPGRKDGDGDTSGQGSVKWQVGDWRPSEGVMKLFEELGGQEWMEFEFQRLRDTKPE